MLTFTRASNATCTKTATGGLATTGIADGDLVVLSSNVARVEYDSNGVLGLLVEAAGTNLLLRYLAIDDVAWSDVGTPTLTTGQTDPFGATGAVKVEDDDAAAFEGRSQAVTVSAGAAYFMHCYVKAGTATKARISIDGTTQDISGLSATTWSIVEKGDASSSGVSIPIQVLVGNAVTDTGTVIFGGCDVKAGTYRTSIVPTAGVAVARAIEQGYFLNAFPAGAQSFAASRYGPTAAETQVFALTANRAAVGYGLGMYRTAASYNSLITGSVPILAYGATLDGTDRVWMAADGTNIYGEFAGTAATTANVTTPSAVTALCVGNDCVNGGSSGQTNGIISRICVDPSPMRCR